MTMTTLITIALTIGEAEEEVLWIMTTISTTMMITTTTLTVQDQDRGSKTMKTCMVEIDVGRASTETVALTISTMILMIDVLDLEGIGN